MGLGGRDFVTAMAKERRVTPESKAATAASQVSGTGTTAEEDEEEERRRRAAAAHTGGGASSRGEPGSDRDAESQISPRTLGGSLRNQAPAMPPLFEASKGGVGRLVGRTGFSAWGALLYTAAASVPFYGAIAGGLTGLYAAYQAIKKENQANPNMPLWQKIVRGTARVVGMTAAGAAAGFLGFPLGPVLIGPAIVAVDKICGIGAHPEKTFARHMGDLMGAMIPGAGVVNYLDYRNNSLTTGLPLQPIAPYTPKTPSASVEVPAVERAVASPSRAPTVAQTHTPPTSMTRAYSAPTAGAPSQPSRSREALPAGAPIVRPARRPSTGSLSSHSLASASHSAPSSIPTRGAGGRDHYDSAAFVPSKSSARGADGYEAEGEGASVSSSRRPTRPSRRVSASRRPISMSASPQGAGGGPDDGYVSDAASFRKPTRPSRVSTTPMSASLHRETGRGSDAPPSVRSTRTAPAFGSPLTGDPAGYVEEAARASSTGSVVSASSTPRGATKRSGRASGHS